MAKAKINKASSLACPPVVSVLGHIDHGKTSLLDKIRETNVAASEVGGITQHIGAYQIKFKGEPITFLDTPGHAAFAKMRARGAEATDLAVLVVAGDEGVKPQTKESLKFIKEAKIPYLVVVSKIDLETSNVEKVIAQLAKEGVKVEKKGGEVVVAPVSARTGEGIEDLLEMILLLGQMEDLKADPAGEFKGIVVESELDRSRGPVATILVKNGTLAVSDLIWAEGVRAKVKAMHDEMGQKVTQAGPSKPVKVLGFASVPSVGAPVTASQKEVKPTEPAVKKPVEKDEEEAKEEDKRLRLILKADTQGTLEAIRLNLPSGVKLVYQGVGDLGESDVLLAQTTRAKLIAFNVRTPTRVKKLAEVEKVKITSYRLIYELLEEIKKDQEKILKPRANEEVLGKAEILAGFQIGKKKVAGGRVLQGRIAQGDLCHLKRNEEILGDCRIRSLKKGKQDAEKAKEEEEFGAFFKPQLDFETGDMIVSFRKLPS